MALPRARAVALAGHARQPIRLDDESPTERAPSAIRTIPGVQAGRMLRPRPATATWSARTNGARCSRLWHHLAGALRLVQSDHLPCGKARTAAQDWPRRCEGTSAPPAPLSSPNRPPLACGSMDRQCPMMTAAYRPSAAPARPTAVAQAVVRVVMAVWYPGRRHHEVGVDDPTW